MYVNISIKNRFGCLDEEKTSSQKEMEENLLKELDQIVRQRDGIVDSIEVDRKRSVSFWNCS